MLSLRFDFDSRNGGWVVGAGGISIVILVFANTKIDIKLHMNPGTSKNDYCGGWWEAKCKFSVLLWSKPCT